MNAKLNNNKSPVKILQHGSINKNLLQCITPELCLSPITYQSHIFRKITAREFSSI